ncbi:hypothetical protein [Ruegeria arenilitoris]|uniref:hypothetical protein n=1 Tax=Ruegeria arenilitoris TaxID=1173585 RepID=UPI00147E70D5|nr:hypothetical protein [Ruegeria arenilitoris]
MELISDIFLVAGALGAGLYCFVLARRLRRFTDLERGVGGAVSVLSAQGEELKKSLDAARAASDQSGHKLQDLTERAESVAQRLELIMVSMHDVIPEDKPRAKEPANSSAETKKPSPLEVEPVSLEEKVGPKDPEQPAEPAAVEQMPSRPEAEVKSTNDPAEDPAPIPKGVLFFRHKAQGSEARS